MSFNCISSWKITHDTLQGHSKARGNEVCDAQAAPITSLMVPAVNTSSAAYNSDKETRRSLTVTSSSTASSRSSSLLVECRSMIGSTKKEIVKVKSGWVQGLRGGRRAKCYIDRLINSDSSMVELPVIKRGSNALCQSKTLLHATVHRLEQCSWAMGGEVINGT